MKGSRQEKQEYLNPVLFQLGNMKPWPDITCEQQIGMWNHLTDVPQTLFSGRNCNNLFSENKASVFIQDYLSQPCQ